jgi:hypothetical protein
MGMKKTVYGLVCFTDLSSNLLNEYRISSSEFERCQYCSALTIKSLQFSYFFYFFVFANQEYSFHLLTSTVVTFLFCNFVYNM